VASRHALLPAEAAGVFAVSLLLAAGPAMAQSSILPRNGGVIGLMGFNVTPDGSANVLQVNRNVAGPDEGDPTLTLSQFGFGFTVSESVPLFIESYLGFARYDPRAVFTSSGERRSPLRWNNATATVGVGWDFAIAENLYLRPIVNVAAGYAAGDASLFASFIQRRRDVDISALTDRHVNMAGGGGSLTLAYYDFRPEREIEAELRYTQIRLQTVGDTMPAARGTSTAETASLWSRVRWPTGREAFGRPIRWVLDGAVSSYLGDQREMLGFSWSAKIGGGIEVDVGRQEVGALGLSVSRLRLVARYFYAEDSVTGVSVGLGIGF